MSKKKYFEMYKPQIISIIPRETLQKDLNLMTKSQINSIINFRIERDCYDNKLNKSNFWKRKNNRGG